MTAILSQIENTTLPDQPTKATKEDSTSKESMAALAKNLTSPDSPPTEETIIKVNKRIY